MVEKKEWRGQDKERVKKRIKGQKMRRKGKKKQLEGKNLKKLRVERKIIAEKDGKQQQQQQQQQKDDDKEK